MSRELEALLRAAKAARTAFEENGPEDVDVWRRVALAVQGSLLQAGQATADDQGRRSAGRGAPPTDYLETFHRFWQTIVGPLDGLDPDKVARELHDYSHLMSEVPVVYCHITGDRMSYVTYYAADVCALADEHYDRIAQEHGRERAAEALREVVDQWQGHADEGEAVVAALLHDIGQRIEALEGADRADVA